MIHTFKMYGQRYALDMICGAVHKITDIQENMLRYVTFPLSDDFPVTLRYDLARYEAASVKNDYFALKKLCDDGVFMAKEGTGAAKAPFCAKEPDVKLTFSAKKPVFASEVIRAAQDAKRITATEDDTLPVAEKDYDILENEYERVAKEIIKRSMGRVPLEPFDFVPFELPFAADEKGYTYLPADVVDEAFGENGSAVKKKIVQCAIAVHFVKTEG